MPACELVASSGRTTPGRDVPWTLDRAKAGSGYRPRQAWRLRGQARGPALLRTGVIRPGCCPITGASQCGRSGPRTESIPHPAHPRWHGQPIDHRRHEGQHRRV